MIADTKSQNGDLSIKSGVSVSTLDEAVTLSRYGLERKKDGLVGWLSSCREHPKNWSPSRKTFDTLVIILLEFYTTVISTTGAASAAAAGPQFAASQRVSIIAFTLMYQIGQAIGGCTIPPLSELIGRRIPYLVSCAAFSLACLTTGLSPSIPLVAISRFIAGLASAVPSVVIAGSVEDMFDIKERVWIVILWNGGTTVGLCAGPIYAAYISEFVGWRWTFHSAAAVTLGMFVALFGIRESRPSLLLRAKIDRVRQETGLTSLDWHNPDAVPSLRSLLDTVIIRPFHILATEPIVIMVAITSAVSWGLIYLFTESLVGIYVSMGFSRTEASLPFIAMAIGVLFTVFPRIWDMRVVKSLKERGVPIQPEDKIFGFAFAAPALSIGLAWFFWSIPPLVPGLHWMLPTASLALIGFAVNEIAYTLSGYLADAYLLYSASAFAGLAFLRAVVSGLMPLIAHEIFDNLGANVGGSILIGASVVFCLMPWIFFRYSMRLRERSPFARFSLATHCQTAVDAE